MTLYLDDSGARKPDRNPKDQVPQHGHDWFALGGIIIRDDDVVSVEAAHATFCRAWQLTYPLHSSEIRNQTRNFRWLRVASPSQQERFKGELASLITIPALTAIACVIDRPGYNARYRTQFGEKRWFLCKTAFNVVVERAAKFARASGSRLRVFVERSDRETDQRIKSYYDELRNAGQPFDAQRSAKYRPLSGAQLTDTLFEFRLKDKTSRLMQLADMVLWPMCIGGYDRGHESYRALLQARALIDFKLAPADVQCGGVKYSCWELETQKHQSPVLIEPGFGAAAEATS